jgi:hypothetical protein
MSIHPYKYTYAQSNYMNTSERVIIQSEVIITSPRNLLRRVLQIHGNPSIAYGLQQAYVRDHT